MIKRKYYENGQLWYEFPYHEGLKHGTEKWWYYDGQLQHESQYNRGQLHGIAKGWRCDGEIIYERYYLYNNQVTQEEYRHHELVEKLSGL